jgi:hypothetical protein
MNILQQSKLVGITPPAARVDNAAVTTTAVDTFGFNKMKVVVYLGDTDIAMTALKLTESDDSGMSGATDITGAIFGTSVNPDTGATSALPTASDDNKFFVFFVDLKGRKRYIDLAATAGDGTAGTFIAAWAELSDALTVPSTAAGRGAAANLIV